MESFDSTSRLLTEETTEITPIMYFAITSSPMCQSAMNNIFSKFNVRVKNGSKSDVNQEINFLKVTSF